MKKFKILLLAVIAVMTLTMCHDAMQQSQSQIVLKSLPFVQANINGEDAWLLLDTGASLSLIDSTFVAQHEMVGKERSIKRLSYVTGALQVSHAIDADIVIANGTVKLDMFIDDISDILKQLSKALGHEVVGILGCDYMTKSGSLIDIGNCKMYMLKVHAVPMIQQDAVQQDDYIKDSLFVDCLLNSAAISKF